MKNQIYKTIDLVADKDATILIEGDTGTGKELIAEAVHHKSKRKNNRFIPINCGALAESLLESELFGYEKGAFTGAVSRKYGIFESANKGTVFLDEINNASLNVQVKLLRYIEMGKLMRVGGNEEIDCDTRIIAATNQDLIKMIEEKKFREDLYHRLNVIKIILPPLHKRKEDITLLINHFLNMYNKKFNKNIKISLNAYDHLNQYSWPGNIRQLKNLIQSLVLLNETERITTEDLPEKIRKEDFLLKNDKNLSFKELKNDIVTEFETKYLIKLLKENNGNVTRTAKISKLSRRMLINKLNDYNIDASQYKNS